MGVRKKIVYLVDKTHLFKISNLVYDRRKREISKTREGVHTGDDNETTLRKWEPIELGYSKFLLLDLSGSSEIKI